MPLHREVALTARREPPARTALVDVVLPADAALSFQGVPMTEESGAAAPVPVAAAEPGRNYTYDVRATWKDREGQEVVRTRRLTVRAGDHLEVDLTRGTMPRADDLEEQRPELRTQPLRDCGGCRASKVWGPGLRPGKRKPGPIRHRLRRPVMHFSSHLCIMRMT